MDEMKKTVLRWTSGLYHSYMYARSYACNRWRSFWFALQIAVAQQGWCIS
jgi:hypothetical protein